MSSAALKLRTFTRPIVRVTPVFRNTIRMSSTNEYGQGKSHATGESAVPNKVQDAAPSALEEALPDSVCSIPVNLIDVRRLITSLGPPHRRQGRPVHLQDPRLERWRRLYCSQEDPGDRS